MTEGKIRLSVGAAPGQRAVAAVAGVLCIAFGAIFVLLPVYADRMLRRLTGTGDPFPSLQGRGLTTLPPYELRALADAITAGRPEHGRDADAHALAGRLRARAGDPLGR